MNDIGRVDGSVRVRGQSVGQYDEPSQRPMLVLRDSLESPQDLVREVCGMVLRQLLRANDAMQVRLHELLNEVDLLEGVKACRTHDVQDRDDVLRHITLLPVPQQLELSQRAQSEHLMLEWLDLLDGDLHTRRPVNGRAYHSVRPFSNDIANSIARADVEADEFFQLCSTSGRRPRCSSGSGSSGIGVARRCGSGR